jgi:multidrug efflux pump subunit AcrB
MVQAMPHVDACSPRPVASCSAARGANAGRGSLDILLAPAKEREADADQWVRMMQDSIDARGFAGARVGVRPPRIRGLRTSSSGEDVSIAVVGDDIAVLRRSDAIIARRLQGTPGLENFQNPQDEAVPLLSIELDRERARARGLNVQQVGQTVRTALDGTIATRYAEGNFEYDVRVFFPRGRFNSVNNLRHPALRHARRAPGALRRRGERADRRSDRRHQAREPEPPDPAQRRRAHRDVAVGAVTDSIRARLADWSSPTATA